VVLTAFGLAPLAVDRSSAGAGAAMHAGILPCRQLTNSDMSRPIEHGRSIDVEAFGHECAADPACQMIVLF
jgi:hypothetical protein